ncbi:MAG: DNA integrity scanning diadenylate cyclase DisA [Actinomycetota bacterium]|nr:DNA integrity scanning diadenylate cyclase DisA [Actinomycetota bacterium]
MRYSSRRKAKLEKLIGVLEKVAPGTEFREAIDRILAVGTGALIVVGEITELRPIMSGGFEIDKEFSAPRLYELAKMDGAVVITNDLGRIDSANVHLVPDPSIPTHEAGTRHRTAERVAKQTGSFVIAISEKMKTVSIYFGDEHFTLESIPLVLAKADQALQTLGRYRTGLEGEFKKLNALELEDSVTLRDVVKVIQRVEMVMRMADEVRFQASELGTDGRLIGLQLNELMAGIARARRLLIEDYYIPRDDKDAERISGELSAFDPEELTDETAIARLLGYRGTSEIMNKLVRPRGYRILSVIPRIPGSVIENIVSRFENLKNIMRASPALLDEVEGVGERRAFAIKEGLDRITASLGQGGYVYG